jgi:hypothetical protein
MFEGFQGNQLVVLLFLKWQPNRLHNDQFQGKKKYYDFISVSVISIKDEVSLTISWAVAASFPRLVGLSNLSI